MSQGLKKVCMKIKKVGKRDVLRLYLVPSPLHHEKIVKQFVIGGGSRAEWASNEFGCLSTELLW